MTSANKITVITGLTASGKTTLACRFASEISAHIIGADSRQVYQGMDIGTGKDLDEFTVNGTQIPYHLIDHIPPDQHYDIHAYQKDFYRLWKNLKAEHQTALLCGGSGLYVESAISPKAFSQIPVNEKLRLILDSKSKAELQAKFQQIHPKYKVDRSSKKRLIRAIEIHHFLETHPEPKPLYEPLNPLYIVCFSSPEARRKRISERLTARLNQGLIEEVEELLSKGISHERLQYFGLEYKFVSQFLLNDLTKDELFTQLHTAICRYAKRQMTWMRGLDKRSENLHFFDVSDKKSTDYLSQLTDLHHDFHQ
ncbi:MAG: tRNA (adenosine(37)-N6)-dimethylallyltransferase MiaA [Flavobacteriales bacterium]